MIKQVMVEQVMIEQVMIEQVLTWEAVWWLTGLMVDWFDGSCRYLDALKF